MNLIRSESANGTTVAARPPSGFGAPGAGCDSNVAPSLCYCRGDHDPDTCRFVFVARMNSGCFDESPVRDVRDGPRVSPDVWNTQHPRKAAA